MIVDTSVLLAAFVPDQRMHEPCARALSVGRPLLISPFVLAELDYLTARIAGVDAELAVLDEMSSGPYEIAGFDAIDLMRAHAVIERYRDLPLGLTDASLVVLADKHDEDAIATLDERHFRVVQSLRGKPFRILPADAEL
ncbi:type II toxin-antitoxin system VapC family toxin [Candidatus Poriferisodalis sp.]|uniref:type II toxin-antitoxin system VapC family toxin n=1 Tax=Candidatus Poriferisodalis sp. TaxID=3101277 RepID=UPI003AF4A028